MGIKTSLRKRGIILILSFFSLILLSRIASPKEGEKFKSRFSLKLTGGVGYMSLGEINEDLNTRSILTNRAERFYPIYFSLADEIENVHYGLNFEGELRMNIISNFAIGIGTGYIQAEKESYLIKRGESVTRKSTTHESQYPRVSVIPTKLGIYYKLSLFPRTALLFNIGGGYYFTRIHFFSYQHLEVKWFDEPSPDIYWVENTKKVNGGSFGYHAGIGFEYRLGKSLSIVIEGQQRYAKIKELKGKNIMVNSQGEKKICYGTLWYHHYESEGEYLTCLVVRDRKLEIPPGAPQTIHREAILDLTGFSLRVGIRIKLF